MFPKTFLKTNNNKLTNGGFGLIELLISISIMILVTAIVMSQHNAFNSSVLLRSQAYEIALQAKDTQLTAVSVISDGSGDFREIYGLYFSEDGSANNTYNIFRDADGDSFFDTGEVFGKQGKLDNRFIIDDIRIMEDENVSVSPSQISIIFERPNFDARFFTSSNTEVSPNITHIEIDVRLVGTTGNTNGDVRTVEITKTGQISVI